MIPITLGRFLVFNFAREEEGLPVDVALKVE